MDEKAYWIWLVMVFGAGNPHIWDLMNTCETPYDAYIKVSDGRFFLTKGEQNLLKNSSLDKAEEIIGFCESRNIKIFTYDDKNYPSLLKNIFNPPAVLFVEGNEKVFENLLPLTIVGTRNPSRYGQKAAHDISYDLAKAGFTLISGFAQGVDSFVHRAALEAYGETIAVLGCGIDIVYPRANGDIRELITQNGALVSEFLPGTQPVGKNFPLRNRILSGLSLGVFVVEAPLRSGALITADSAIEQGRDVFCLPPADIFDKSYLGVVKYLRDGAIPVFGHLDIVYEYYTTFSHKLSSNIPQEEYVSITEDSSVFSQKKIKKEQNILTELENKKDTVDITYVGLSYEQEKIVDFLRKSPRHIDDIERECEINMSQLLTEITELEISGIIKSLPGRVYSLQII